MISDSSSKQIKLEDVDSDKQKRIVINRGMQTVGHKQFHHGLFQLLFVYERFCEKLVHIL